MNRRFAAALTLATGGALALAGCGSGSSGDGDGGAYEVLVTGGTSVSGVLADNAKTSILSVKASAKNINAAGGIGGRKVKVRVVDDAGDPTVAVTKLREAIASDHRPDLYLTSGPSSITAATLPILKQNGILSMGVGPTEDSFDPDKFPLNFDVSVSAPDATVGIAHYLAEKGYRSIAVIHGSTAYGVTFGKQVEKAVKDKGLKIAGVEEYDAEALDMTPQLASLKAKNPQALVMDGYGAPVGYLLKGIDKLGWDIPIVGNTAMAATGLITTKPPAGILGTSQLANVVVEVFDSTKYDPGATGVNQAVKAMESLGEIPSSLINSFDYDALPLVAAAAKEAGTSTDPEKLAAALETTEVQDAAKTAILSVYRFSKDSHAPAVGPDAFAFVAPSPLKNGQFQ